ncbi:MAG: hypothetical protein IT567_04750 [Alphaproteobacteria bacterium]|nr:hypothetical protein [Alphaproteobacteria bacterium]
MKIIPVSLTVSALLLVSAAASAQELQGSFGDWNAYTLTQNGAKTCYIASAPVEKIGNYSERGEPYLLVTHRDKGADEVSLSSGYPYQNGSEVEVRIDGGKAQKLFTRDAIAWAYDEAGDKALVAGIKRGNRLEAKGTSQKGSHSTDRYSLKGFSKAYDKMKALCK